MMQNSNLLQSMKSYLVTYRWHGNVCYHSICICSLDKTICTYCTCTLYFVECNTKLPALVTTHDFFPTNCALQVETTIFYLFMCVCVCVGRGGRGMREGGFMLDTGHMPHLVGGALGINLSRLTCTIK